jgi:adenylate cyclase
MPQRRLAAILCADVVGSSRLMEADEGATLSAIRSILSEIVTPTATRHGGRVIKTTGDGALLEFASPVDAVACGIDVQKTVNERARHEPQERRVLLRVGINAGDVVVESDGDLYGDGVNVAVRLEGVADPGGVCVSGKVFDELHGKMSAEFEERGEQNLRNIARPVRIYAWRSNAADSVPRETRSSINRADKPSIVVLPFANLSGDPEQEYFADGTVESLTTALARLRWLFVIARNSSFTYKGRAVDVRQVGRELGVRYVLEGSVRKAQERVRITGQLIDASTGHHVWAESFEGILENVFELQDRLTESVVAAIEPNLRAAEIERARLKPTASLDAYDFYLRALPLLYAQTGQSLREAEALLRAAIKLDPGYTEALAALAECIGLLTLNGWLQEVREGDREACEFARRAVIADPDNGEALATAAWAFALLGRRFEPALEWAERALELLPNSLHVRHHCGSVFVASGESDRAIEQFRVARSLNPMDPRGYVALNCLAAAHFFAQRFEETIRLARRILDEWPAHNISRRYLAAALAHLGRLDEATEVIEELRAQQPNSCLTRSRQSGYRHKWMLDLYIDGLKLAGLPE